MEAQVSETRRIHRGILGGGSGQEAGRVGWLWSWSLELHWLWKWHKGSQEEEQKVTWGSTSDKWKQSGVFELALMIRWAAKCVRARHSGHTRPLQSNSENAGDKNTSRKHRKVPHTKSKSRHERQHTGRAANCAHHRLATGTQTLQSDRENTESTCKM